MNDYGVETVDLKGKQSADSKKTADKTPSAELTKQMGKVGLGQKGENMQIGDYGIELLSTSAKPFVPGGSIPPTTQEANYVKHPKGQTPIVQDDEDEEDPYASPIQITHQKEASADYLAQMKQAEEEEKYAPEDTMVVFTSQDFLYLDFQNDTWAQGDIQQAANQVPLYIPENASIVKVNQDVHKCFHSHIFVTGGVNKQGQILNWTFGGRFSEETVQGQKSMQFAMTYSDQDMLLQINRMMHESCIVRNQKGEFILLLIGGKVGNTLSACGYTNSVIGYEMNFVFQPWLKAKVDPKTTSQVGWKSLDSMKFNRANFGLSVCENFVYVFGGIAGKGEGKESHMPTLSAIVEKYDPCQDAWSTLEIKGAPQCGAFGYTVLPPNGDRIMILGGTDGEIIQEECWIIDFKNEKAEYQPQSVEQPLAMSKLIYREKANTVYCIGGYGSGGQSHQLKFKSGSKWQEFPRSHTSLLSPGAAESELELSCQTSVYFQ